MAYVVALGYRTAGTAAVGQFVMKHYGIAQAQPAHHHHQQTPITVVEASVFPAIATKLSMPSNAQKAYRRALQLCDAGAPCVGAAADDAGACALSARSLVHARSLEDAVHECVSLGYQNADAKGKEQHIEQYSSSNGCVDAVLTRKASVAELPLFNADATHVNAIDGISAGVLLPGSFNPPHDGHIELMRRAEQAVGTRGAYELTVLNPDKGSVASKEVQRRAQLLQHAGDNAFAKRTLVVSACKLFSDKARVMPGTAFAVGVDTAERILDKRYYNHSEDVMRNELQELADNSCRLLVAGRKLSDESEYRELRDISHAIPAGLEHIFQSIPAFRVDASSTALRQQSHAQQ